MDLKAALATGCHRHSDPPRLHPMQPYWVRLSDSCSSQTATAGLTGKGCCAQQRLCHFVSAPATTTVMRPRLRGHAECDFTPLQAQYLLGTTSRCLALPSHLWLSTRSISNGNMCMSVGCSKAATASACRPCGPAYAAAQTCGFAQLGTQLCARRACTGRLSPAPPSDSDPLSA